MLASRLPPLLRDSAPPDSSPTMGSVEAAVFEKTFHPTALILPRSAMPEKNAQVVRRGPPSKQASNASAQLGIVFALSPSTGRDG